jgi:predicted kinase
VSRVARLECVILIGLQGSGKTTFYRSAFGASHAHVSQDLFPSARDKARRQQRLLSAAFAEGRSVVVDNTNATVASRAPLIALAREWDAEVVGYYFDVSTREAVARNARRSGRARVGNVAIFATAKRLEPPTPAEGFDRLYRVRPRDEARFEIFDEDAGSSP